MKYLAIAVCIVGSALARPDGTGHDHGHSHAHSGASAPSAPSSGYAQPSSGYAQPSTGYAQPATGYDTPSTGYDTPSSGYDTPATGYDAGYSTGYETGYDTNTGYAAPSDSYGAEVEPAGVPPFSLIIIPLLIVAGLALLFPSTTQVAVRRKRDSEDEAASPNSLAERVQDIYMAMVESEECMERIACEVGGIAQDAGLDRSLFSVAEPFVPSKYSKYVKKFSTGKDCHKIKCGNFF